MASEPAIARRYARATGWRGVTTREILHRADAGDPTAASICTEAAEALADALATAVTLYDPQRVVIGGGLAGFGVLRSWPATSSSTG